MAESGGRRGADRRRPVFRPAWAGRKTGPCASEWKWETESTVDGWPRRIPREHGRQDEYAARHGPISDCRRIPDIYVLRLQIRLACSCGGTFLFRACLASSRSFPSVNSISRAELALASALVVTTVPFPRTTA